MQRKNKPTPKQTPLTEFPLPPQPSIPTTTTTTTTTNNNNNNKKKPTSPNNNNNNTNNIQPPLSHPTLPPNLNKPPVIVATAYRRKCGTGPFDEHWLNLDCCGLFCACLTYMLHLYGCYAFCAVLIPPWMNYKGIDGIRRMSIAGRIHCLAFISVAILAILSHFRAMTTDPGAVPPDATPLPDDAASAPPPPPADGDAQPPPPPPRPHRKLCRRCNAFKPQRAHHCSICRRCIVKMDHHCPWVNNCVGIGNHKFFLLFIFYTFVSCSYSCSMLGLRFVMCVFWSDGRSGRCLDEPTQVLPLLGLLVEALLFGLFTSCMMCDQWDVVTSNITHIDRLKNEDHNNNASLLTFSDDLNDSGYGRAAIRKRRPTGLNEVFGIDNGGGGGRPQRRNRFNWGWLSPLVVASFPPGVREEIYGFCKPCITICGTTVGMGEEEEMEMGLLNSRKKPVVEVL